MPTTIPFPTIQQASMTGLVRLLLIILIIYAIYRILARYVFPFAVRYYLKRMEREFYNRNPHLRDEPKKKEGDVTIEQQPGKTKGKISDDTGEYVDYQDIND